MLINCVAYENGRKLADISVDDISDWLHKPDSFVWVALRDPPDEELAQMQQEFGLHELAVEDARKGHQRPKIEEYGDMVFVVLHLPDPRPDADAEDVGEVAIFVGHNYVLSVRRRSKQDSWACANAASASRCCYATAPALCCMPSWTRWWIAISR